MAHAQATDLGRTVNLRLILTAVILLALIPPILLLGIAIWRAGNADRDASSAQFLSQARTMANMFASALDANMSVIDAIVDFDSSRSGTIAGLSEMSSFLSAEIAAPGDNPAFPKVPARAHGWAVSNLFDIEPGVTARLAITLNTGHEDGPTEGLTFVTEPRQLTRALRFDTGAYGETLVAVVDGNGRVIARSRDEDRFIGAAVPTWSALVAVGAPSGIFSAELLDGDSITFAFSTIQGTPGWVVVAGVPSAIFNARWREPLLYLAGGGIAAILAATVLALIIARRIARPLTALASYARTAVTGSPGSPPAASGITEYETLRNTLINAQQRLVDRANRLAVSEARYRAVAKIGSVVTWRQTLSGDLIELDGWEELTGQPSGAMLGNGWMRSIHPEDLTAITGKWRTALRDLTPLDFECRVELATADWMYVRVRGICIVDATGAPAEWAGTVENIHERKMRELRDFHLAFHDQLTDLPNRSLMREHLANANAAATDGAVGALLYVDLDYFKLANDTYGHAAGDTLLRMVADRLRTHLRASDTAARIGGDEFAVILRDIGSIAAAETISARIVRSLSTPFKVDRVTITIGASIGIAPIDGVSAPDDICKRADLALYQAKDAGRNGWSVYNPSHDQRLRA